MAITIPDLEHRAALGWRAPEEERLGDWLLRAAGGFEAMESRRLDIDPVERLFCGAPQRRFANRRLGVQHGFDDGGRTLHVSTNPAGARGSCGSTLSAATA